MAQSDSTRNQSIPATITAGTSLSGPVTMPWIGYGILRLDMPPAWTGAPITFQTSEDGNNFRDLYISINGTETEVSVAASANHSVALDPTIFGTGISFIKFRSGTGGVPVNQTAGAVIGVVCRLFS